MLTLQSDDGKRYGFLRKELPKESSGYAQDVFDSLVKTLDYNVINNYGYHCYRKKYDLIRHYQISQDKGLLELLIQNNLKLVKEIASKYLNYLGNTHTMEDLISEGVLGLIKAIKKFNPSLGYDFSAYASYWIRVVIVRSIMNTGTMVRIPVYMIELILKIEKLEQSYRWENRPINVQTICGKLQITLEKYKEAKLVEYQFPNFIDLDSFEAEAGDPDSGGYIRTGRYNELQCSKEEFADPALMVEKVDFKMFIRRILSTLSERECNIIKLRFGFCDGSVKTLQEVGEIYGVTRERIRQIEIKALKKLLLKLD
ncbi:MAG: sigma-70 family RNA polymerase sigma factor [Desulfosporosinus sp.]|nr:sigma-70 family RNA polymerase sigma factor [Desulfosporosinus sp.]